MTNRAIPLPESELTQLAAEHVALVARLEKAVEALKLAAGYISHEQIEHAWINAPEKPAIELGAFLRAAIAKATQTGGK